MEQYFVDYAKDIAETYTLVRCRVYNTGTIVESVSSLDMMRNPGCFDSDTAKRVSILQQGGHIKFDPVPLSINKDGQRLYSCFLLRTVSYDKLDIRFSGELIVRERCCSKAFAEYLVSLGMTPDRVWALFDKAKGAHRATATVTFRLSKADVLRAGNSNFSGAYNQLMYLNSLHNFYWILPEKGCTVEYRVGIDGSRLGAKKLAARFEPKQGGIFFAGSNSPQFGIALCPTPSNKFEYSARYFLCELYSCVLLKLNYNLKSKV